MPLTLSGTSGVLDNSGAFIAGTAVASTSGTSIDFTSIPSWVKRITVMLNEVSLSGTAGLAVQIGDSGGIETTDYIAGAIFSSSVTGTPTYSTTRFPLNTAGVASEAYSGVAVLVLLNLSTNMWAINGNISRTASAGVASFAGVKALSNILTQVRITTSNGTDTFDAGSINILYE
jgi:hypothetical protein